MFENEFESSNSLTAKGPILDEGLYIASPLVVNALQGSGLEPTAHSGLSRCEVNKGRASRAAR